MSTVFTIYRLVNANSICGYPSLATTNTRDLLLSISNDLIALQLSMGWEENQWLNTDYVRSEDTITFNMNGIIDVIQKTYSESAFSMIVFLSSGTQIRNISLAFGSDSASYYEIDLESDGRIRRNRFRNEIYKTSQEECKMFQEIVSAFVPIIKRFGELIGNP